MLDAHKANGTEPRIFSRFTFKYCSKISEIITGWISVKSCNNDEAHVDKRDICETE